MIDILTIENDKIVPDLNCKSIPELQTLIDTYEDSTNALLYVYHMVAPFSSYVNIPEDDKEDILLEDFPGDYGAEDVEIQEAINKLNKLYRTPTRHFFLNAKKGLEKLGDYMADAKIESGKDGNFSAYSMTFTRIGKIIQEFKQLEKLYEEENDTGVRGGHEIGYDE